MGRHGHFPDGNGRLLGLQLCKVRGWVISGYIIMVLHRFSELFEQVLTRPVGKGNASLGHGHAAMLGLTYGAHYFTCSAFIL